jgi:eukaryotic-like serine/threonine-protein kinase
MPDSSQPSDNTPNVAGRMAGEYRLVRKLGEGGFGAVYEAEHPVLRRRAAVKVLHQVAGVDSDAVLRFISEAQAANHVRSRHIVDVFSFGKLSNGRHFYVMDLLDGDPLDRFLRKNKRCDVPTALQLLRPIADALDAAHAAGVVHRDLKPQNVFLSWESSGETVPKLLDFGMAKLLGDSAVHTVSGVPIGTPLYMSPEQARGEKVDGRSDVYALGVLCHEMLTGQVPFTGDSPLAVLMCHLTVPPPRASEVYPELPAVLDDPILHMLHKEPSGRPATAGQAISALIAAAESAGVHVPAGMPQLPRPISLPPSRPSFANADTPSASLAPSAVDSAFLNARAAVDADFAKAHAAIDRAEMLMRTDRAGRSRSRGWALWALLVALAGGALYLGTSAINASSGIAPTSGFGDQPAEMAPKGTDESDGPAPTAEKPAAPPEAAALTAAEDLPVTSPASPAPPASVRFTPSSTPRGARVWLDGKALGDAEAGVALPYGDAPLTITVTAPGHEPQTIQVTPNADASPEVKLKKKAKVEKPGGAIPSDLESPF